MKHLTFRGRIRLLKTVLLKGAVIKLLIIQRKEIDMLIIRKASTFFGRIRITDRSKNTVLLCDTDRLIFAVRKDPDDENAAPLIKKIITPDREFEGGYGFELTPEDTSLPAGSYCYDVGVQRQDGEFYHIIPADEFIVKASVARKEGQTIYV